MNQTNRVLSILEKLTKKQVVCTNKLISVYKSYNDKESDDSAIERKIQRDINILKKFLKESLTSPQRGCYQLINNNFFSTILQSKKETKALKQFFEFLAIFDTEALKFLENKEFSFFHKMQKETRQIYSIFDSPIEELKKSDLLEPMKQAIKNHQYCDVVYHEKEPIMMKDIQPQKILYAKNNWYLAVMTKEDNFKRLRINFIHELTLKSKTFHSNLQAIIFIEKMQSLFQDFDSPNYEVQVSVSSNVARYFKEKRFLSSQKIISHAENGDILLSFEINNDMELIPLIKMWIPHLKVLSPKRLDKKIKEELKLY